MNESNTTPNAIILGKVNTDSENPCTANVLMSTENFLRLITPLFTKKEANVHHELQAIRDTLTQLSMESVLTRKDIIDCLEMMLESTKFREEVKNFYNESMKQAPKTVGKINLEKYAKLEKAEAERPSFD